MRPINENEILAQAHNLLNEQTRKGVKKYGQTVDPHSMDAVEWIDHAVQESVDHIVYLLCLKARLVGGGR